MVHDLSTNLIAFISKVPRRIRNVSNYSPNDKASHPHIRASSATPLTEPQIFVCLCLCEKVMRKIRGSIKNQDGCLKIRTNEEIDLLIKGGDIFRYRRAQRLDVLGML